MRLTLRTLLAYLDDTLDPEQTRLIGQKVAESDAAQELIARIKLVTRRRRLTTPADMDPNTVAEYLENALSGEDLARVEEICLSSDVHLAEVAASHQILTLVLGEPALVPPVAKQRMYKLIQGREAIHTRKAPQRVAAVPAAEAASSHDEADEALLLGLPVYRKDTAWLRWVVPLAGGCLFLGLLLAILMALYPLLSPTPSAAVVPPAPEKADAPRPDPGKPHAPEPVVPRPGEPEKTEQPDAVPVAEVKPPAEPDPEPEKIHKPLPMPEAPSDARADLGRYVLQQPPSILLQPVANRNQWQRLRPERRVASGDTLVSLPGYRSDLALDSKVQLTLWGNLPEYSRTEVRESRVVLHANPDLDLDFTLERGRVVLANQKPDGPARIRVRFHDEIWDLALQDNVTAVALELVGFCQPYEDASAPDPVATLALIGLKGQANVRIRYQEHQLPASTIYVWENYGRPWPAPRPLMNPPEWWVHKSPPPTQAVLAANRALGELNTRLLDERIGIDVALTELLKSNDPLARVLAVRCLAAVDDLSGLLDALTDERYPDIRLFAVEVLKHWLGQKGRHNRQLTQTLVEKKYTQTQTDILMRLLHGFTDPQYQDPALRSTLTEYLNHDKLAIRQAAHVALVTGIPEGQKIRYDPAGDTDQRERAYDQWRRLIHDPKLKAK